LSFILKNRFGLSTAAFVMVATIMLGLVGTSPTTTYAAAQTCTPSATTFNNNVATSVTLTAGAGTINNNTGATSTLAAGGTVTLTGVATGGSATTLSGTIPAGNWAGTSAGIVVTGGTDDCTTGPTALTFNGLAIGQNTTLTIPTHGLSSQTITIRGTVGGAALATTTIVTVTTDKGEFTATGSGGAVTPSKSVQLLLNAGTVSGSATGTVTWRGIAGESAGTVNFTASANQSGTSLFKTTTGTTTVPTASDPVKIDNVDQTYGTHKAIGYRSSSAEYQPWGHGSLLIFRAVDGSGNGASGRVLKVTTDKGSLVDASTLGTTETAIQGACGTSTTPKTIFVTTVSAVTGPLGGSNTSGSSVGRAGVVLCGAASGEAGTATVTVVDNQLASVSQTRQVDIAKKSTSANISATVDGNTVTVNVTDPAGLKASDMLKVNFSVVPSTEGAVTDSCVLLKNGAASTQVAVTPGKTVTVLASVSENGDGLCATASVRTYGSTTVTVGGSTGSTGGSTSGSGTISSGSVPAAGGFGLVVFGGGTTDQLVAASGCPAATSAFYATVNGDFVTYVPGTSIAAVNAAFMAAFPAGIPAGTPLIGKCK
jgi:hypothetical protein